MKNFETRHGNFEISAVVKNQRVKQREQRTGSVRKETIAVSATISMSVRSRHSQILLQDFPRSRMCKMHREPRVQDIEA